ncbi:hypothetical protein [Micropruina sp.]|uniref:hypothetical protein n=1 Tax=Micropruina sp. TaxID=2737536 RepID=UPI0039E3F419
MSRPYRRGLAAQGWTGSDGEQLAAADSVDAPLIGAAALIHRCDLLVEEGNNA